MGQVIGRGISSTAIIARSGARSASWSAVATRRRHGSPGVFTGSLRPSSPAANHLGQDTPLHLTRTASFILALYTNADFEVTPNVSIYSPAELYSECVRIGSV